MKIDKKILLVARCESRWRGRWHV